MAHMARLLLGSRRRWISHETEILQFFDWGGLCGWTAGWCGISRARRRTHWLGIIARELAPEATSREGLCALDSHLTLIGNFISSQGLGTRCGKRLRVRIATSTSTTPISSWLRLIWGPVIKCGKVHNPGITSCVFRQAVGVAF